jgi:hypothetical protein
LIKAVGAGCRPWRKIIAETIMSDSLIADRESACKKQPQKFSNEKSQST